MFLPTFHRKPLKNAKTFLENEEIKVTNSNIKTQYGDLKC